MLELFDVGAFHYAVFSLFTTSKESFEEILSMAIGIFASISKLIYKVKVVNNYCFLTQTFSPRYVMRYWQTLVESVATECCR